VGPPLSASGPSCGSPPIQVGALKAVFWTRLKPLEFETLQAFGRKSALAPPEFAAINVLTKVSEQLALLKALARMPLP
jgi:hypothetical protein